MQFQNGGILGNRKIRITVETDSVLLVRRRNSRRAWCEKCADFTESASFEEADALASADAATLTRLVRSERLHLIKGTNESLFVCLLSILKQIAKVEGPRLKLEEVQMDRQSSE